MYHSALPQHPIILIPTRLAAARLPRKPLADIAGSPMILHVWRRAVAADLGPVVVASGDREIADIVEREGGRAVLTEPDLPTGSDRIHAAITPLDPEPHYEHIGLYAYRRAALERFVTLPRGVLEQRERLEQLRALEAGMRFSVSLIDKVRLGVQVDTPADLERARELMSAK